MSWPVIALLVLVAMWVLVALGVLGLLLYERFGERRYESRVRARRRAHYQSIDRFAKGGRR